jgi:hypothetical protein
MEITAGGWIAIDCHSSLRMITSSETLTRVRELFRSHVCGGGSQWIEYNEEMSCQSGEFRRQYGREQAYDNDREFIPAPIQGERTVYHSIRNLDCALLMSVKD